ncbi:MAG: hypothetical protein V1911_02220 [Candidatus Micrarchaeota archaeon]
MKIAEKIAGYLKSEKAVEGLPMKYLIIILVAALVIGTALYMVNTLGSGIHGAVDDMNNSLGDEVSNALGPTATLTCGAAQAMSATGSSGDIVLYSFDTNGDGKYEVNNTVGTATGTAAKTVSVIVTDDNGKTDSATAYCV